MKTDNFDLVKFNNLKKYIKSEYEKVGKIYSPAIKACIHFNSDGFHHLRYDSHRNERPKRVQKNKLFYFKDSLEIIKKSTTIQEYRKFIMPFGNKDKSGFSKTKVVEWFAFFAIINLLKRIRIKVIIRRIGGESGQYHFWSIIPYWQLSNKKRIIGSKEIEDN